MQLLWRRWFSGREPRGGEDEATVFHWVRNPLTWLHLSAFFWFSVIIHGAGFYLFQVVYPPPLRIEPEPDSITILDQSDPAVRSLLQRVEDRTVFLIPPSARSDTRWTLQQVPIRFSPSFKEAEVEPIEPDFGWGLPPRIDPTAVTFSEGDEFSSAVRVSFDGALQERSVAPWSIMKEYLEAGSQIPPVRVQLRVDRDGLVEVLTVEGQVTEEDREALAAVVASTLRFQPGSGVSEGWMRVASDDFEW